MICYAAQNNLLKPAEGNSGAIPSCVTTSAGFFIGDKMKQIQLTQGQFTIVDFKNYKWLNQWKWYARWCEGTQSFYAMRNSKTENGKRYLIYMHREILELKKSDGKHSDHVNHNTLDNCELNLRIVTCGQNQFNQKNPKGYYWYGPTKKYHAKIRLNGKDIHLGYFPTAKEARNAYLEAKKKYHKI